MLVAKKSGLGTQGQQQPQQSMVLLRCCLNSNCSSRGAGGAGHCRTHSPTQVGCTSLAQAPSQANPWAANPYVSATTAANCFEIAGWDMCWACASHARNWKGRCRQPGEERGEAGEGNCVKGRGMGSYRPLPYSAAWHQIRIDTLVEQHHKRYHRYHQSGAMNPINHTVPATHNHGMLLDVHHRVHTHLLKTACAMCQHPSQVV